MVDLVAENDEYALTIVRNIVSTSKGALLVRIEKDGVPGGQG